MSLYLPTRGPISFTPVSSEVREKMVEAMATRYNPSTKCLDLSKFYACQCMYNFILHLELFIVLKELCKMCLYLS